jgi:restriction system protein
MKTEQNQEGLLGEQLVSEALTKLPPAYYHLDNLVVPVKTRIGQTTQIDHVVSSQFGIFVIETKKFRGAILGGERDRLWFQILGGQRFLFRNPLDQNRHHVSILAQHLGLPAIVFNPVVAFVGLTQLLSPQLPTNVITTIAPGVPGLRRYIEQITQPILSAEELSAATAKLIELKSNGLTIEDHVRSIYNRDLSRRLAKAMRLRRNTQSEKPD